MAQGSLFQQVHMLRFPPFLFSLVVQVIEVLECQFELVHTLCFPPFLFSLAVQVVEEVPHSHRKVAQ